MNSGDETVTLAEVYVPRCAKTYGKTTAAGSCAAVLGITGTKKCYNGRFTCQSIADYAPTETVMVRFCREQDNLQKYGPAIPALIDVTTTPGSINFGGMDRSAQAFGQREIVDITLKDGKHSDAGFDKYRLERPGYVSRFLELPGGAGNYAKTTWNYTDITTSLDIRASATPVLYGGGTVRTLFAKRDAAPQIGPRLHIGTTGGLVLAWSEDGTVVISATSADASGSLLLPYAASQRAAFRAFLQCSNGSGGYTVTFFTSDDDGMTWQQFGVPIVGVGGLALGATKVKNTTAPLYAGITAGDAAPGQALLGRLHWGEAYINGALSWRFDAAAATQDGVTSFPTDTGHVWVILGTGPTPPFARITSEIISASSDGDEFNPYERGTLIGKFVARNPYYKAYTLIIREGVVGQELEDMGTRTYILDNISGPNDGQAKMTAKDAFSKIDATTAVAPRASTGELLLAITAVDGSCTLAPAGIGDLEYPTSGRVCMGNEVMAFTRVADVLTFTQRHDLNTAADDHDVGDSVQLVLSYTTEFAHIITEDLLLNYGFVDSEQIDPDDWAAQASEMTEFYTAHITEPTPVGKLVGELMVQAGFTVIPDPSENKVKFVATRASAPLAKLTDFGWIKKGTLEIDRLVDRRVSQCWVRYGQIDPTKKIDDKKNFRSRVVTVDSASEGDDENAVPAIKEIFSRWIPTGGRAAAISCGERIVAMFTMPPFEAKLKLHGNRVGALQLARFAEIETDQIQDDTGLPATLAYAIVEIENGENEVSIRGMQAKFANVPSGGGERVAYIENDLNNIVLRDYWDSLFSEPLAGQSIRFEIAEPTAVGSESTSQYAIETGDWPEGVILTLTIKGRLQGKGGKGADGVALFPNMVGAANNGLNGENGGHALLVTFPLRIDNQGKLWAGGGGGPSGGHWNTGFIASGNRPGAGGGGAGIIAGEAGYSDNAPGTVGTKDAGGDGGVDPYGLNGRGGKGGAPGEDAQAGTSPSAPSPAYVPGTPGIKGNAVVGNLNVTWVNVGDTRGALAP